MHVLDKLIILNVHVHFLAAKKHDWCFGLFISGPGAVSPQGERVPEYPSVLGTGVTARLHSLVISVFRGGERLKFSTKLFFKKSAR